MRPPWQSQVDAGTGLHVGLQGLHAQLGRHVLRIEPGLVHAFEEADAPVGVFRAEGHGDRAAGVGDEDALGVFVQHGEAPVDAVPAGVELVLQFIERGAVRDRQGVRETLADTKEKLSEVLRRQAGAQLRGHAAIEFQPLRTAGVPLVILNKRRACVHVEAFSWIINR
jgi:hypothetical protein